MQSLRKTVQIIGLAGSVSLIALSAVAQSESLPQAHQNEAVSPESKSPDLPDLGIALPELPPAPVTITTDDVKATEPKAASTDIALPLPPVADTTFTQNDWQRIAIANLFADDAAMRDLSIAKKDRETLSAFYAASAKPVLWSENGAWTQGAQDLARTLKTADEDGLNPTDYALPDISAPKAVSQKWTDKAWAEAEVKLSLAALRYARDARGARINTARLSNLIQPAGSALEAGDVLADLAGSKNPGITLNSYNPPHAGYQALKAKLASLRENTVKPPPMVNVPKGPALKVGMSDPRVPLIRARFNLGHPTGDANAYDERVASAVADFQKKQGLPSNGALTAQTVAALSGPAAQRLEGDIVANMERWRWLPRDLGEKHIFVNVPEYRLRLVENGHVIHQTRVIVGKAQSQTPIFSENMKYLVVNPSWTIPPSIMKKEFLPGLAADPGYAAKRGYKVVRRGNSISVQQPPGERNALGYVKFMFPNNYAVYLHDTPNRNLFSADKRAFSHGCVRVEQPFELAEEIIGAQGWPEKKLRGLVGKGERYINLRDPLPVHLTYFTLSVDENGNTKTFDDLYGLNKKVRAALGFAA